MDSAAAQLRVVDGLVPPQGSGVHAADPGAGQKQPGGGGKRLVAENISCQEIGQEMSGPPLRASVRPGGCRSYGWVLARRRYIRAKRREESMASLQTACPAAWDEAAEAFVRR